MCPPGVCAPKVRALEMSGEMTGTNKVDSFLARTRFLGLFLGGFFLRRVWG